MAERVARAPADERLRLVRSLNDEEGPFVRIADGEPLDVAAFHESFVRWLERHPVWR
jgi:hypothetical protein